MYVENYTKHRTFTGRYLPHIHYYHPQFIAAYHQHGVLHIINFEKIAYHQTAVNGDILAEGEIIYTALP